MPLTLRPWVIALAAVAAVGAAAAPARAVLDIEDHGPVLDPGGMRLRVTNAGILGNAFFDVGLSNDPSFEFPSHSGHECLHHAALWVGALNERGAPHVSGGPLLEWRPTLDPSDRVRIARAGDLGMRRLVDDDGDGQIDEEQLNGRDDDGDGEIDEDCALIGQTMAVCDYVDDRPEAVNFGYRSGEAHEPFGLSVHQEAYGWDFPGFMGTAGIHYVITNHSGRTLRGVYVGLLADLDSRALADRTGHLNDRISRQVYSAGFNEGFTSVLVGTVLTGTSCVSTRTDTLPVLTDGVPGSGLPAVTLVGLGHTVDTGALFAPYAAYARAPGHVAFRYTIFAKSRGPGAGGEPTLDADRYAALAGSGSEAATDRPDDYEVLASCGPFPTLAPSQTIEFDVALVAAQDPDSLRVAVGNVLSSYHGFGASLEPDSLGAGAREWNVGRSGLNGHEVCLEPPPGVTFVADPNCPEYFTNQDIFTPGDPETYSYGHCVWTNADCNLCTGRDGKETIEHWIDPGLMPPSPAFRVTPGDHVVKVEWDNEPEILLNAHLVNSARSKFVGYRLYRLADWRNRGALLPPLQNWALVHAYASTTLNGEVPLASIIDSTLDYDHIEFSQKRYPIGRYSSVDSTALNGFDYLYVVSTVMDFSYIDRTGVPAMRRVESPIIASFDQRVVPHVASRPTGDGVWVVPNPFRGHAAWDRPEVPGDELTRHIDFLGLPKTRATIRIYTVSGDFVAQVDHDGSRGDGQASWDLISRNGQDIESGIYLFVVTSALGRQVGHFVVIR